MIVLVGVMVGVIVDVGVASGDTPGVFVTDGVIVDVGVIVCVIALVGVIDGVGNGISFIGLQLMLYAIFKFIANTCDVMLLPGSAMMFIVFVIKS